MTGPAPESAPTDRDIGGTEAAPSPSSAAEPSASSLEGGEGSPPGEGKPPGDDSSARRTGQWPGALPLLSALAIVLFGMQQ